MNIKNYRLSEVSLSDEYLLNALSLETEYLLSLDPDRWLVGFRENAGLDTKGKERYAGWESLLIAGHAFGHYLGACAMNLSNPDVSDEDAEKLLDTVKYICDELRVCQQNSKGRPGFIFAGQILDKDNVEFQFDNIEKGRGDIFKEAWVPWYTMHKILEGLIAVYDCTGYEVALEVAESLGCWVHDRVNAWSSELQKKVLSVEYGGMNDCMYELYRITGNGAYARAAHKFDEEPLFERVLSGEKDGLDNVHANTTIPKFIGALKRYYYLNGKELFGVKIDASRYLDYAKAFFETVRDRHTYITGGNSEWEHFGKDGILDKERTNANNETCNVHNMLKLARLLFMITGDKQYADYYENAYINTILSSQNPVTGMTTYFQAMATGYFKVYSSRYDHFWCCTGTGMENFSKLGDSLYFKDGSDIFVNMYLSSSLIDEENNVVLIQDSEVLKGGDAVFTVSGLEEGSKEFTVRFRIPDWAAGDVTIKYNGKKVSYTEENGYACVTKEFKNCDTITVSIPMELKCFTLPDNEDSVAFKYGPVVLSAGLGSEDMETGTTGVNVTIPKEKKVASEFLTLPEGVSKEEFKNDPGKCFERDGMKFKLKGSELEFTPHYEKYNERYGIYWYIE